MSEDIVLRAMREMADERLAAPDLAATNLVKSYGDRTVVRGMNVSCSCGEIVGVLGPNGAGKTTTFYMIVGLVRPNGGSVVFRGEDITDMPVYQRARRGLGYLSQEPSIFRKLSVRDNVMAILETLKMSRKDRKARCEELLATFDLMKVAKQPAYTLSGGERRKRELQVHVRGMGALAQAIDHHHVNVADLRHGARGNGDAVRYVRDAPPLRLE